MPLEFASGSVGSLVLGFGFGLGAWFGFGLGASSRIDKRVQNASMIIVAVAPD